MKKIEFTEQKFSFPKPRNVKEFSQFVGVSPQMVYYWLNGVNVPTGDKREKIKEWFKMTANIDEITEQT